LLAPDSYKSRFDPSIYAQQPDQAAISQSVSLREQLQAEALRQFVHHPVLGIGSGGFNVVAPNGDGLAYPTGGASISYPHSLPIEVAAELGLVGVVLLAVIAILAIRLMRRGRASDWAFAIITVGTVEAMFTGDISDHRFIWFGLAIAAGEVMVSRRIVGEGGRTTWRIAADNLAHSPGAS
jgi:O-antigen ligase